MFSQVRQKSAAVLWLLLSIPSWVSAEAPGKLSVVTSIRPLTLLVEQLVGDLVEVETLLPANADPHNLSLRISERARLEQADLVVWLGPDFERFLEKPMATRKSSAQLVLGELDGLRWHSVGVPQSASDHAHSGHSHQRGRDMHLWLDPVNAQVALRAIFEHLIVLAPSLEAGLRVRLQSALNDIQNAKTKIAQRLDPLADRGFGVDHNGYGHFVGAFGLNQLAAINEVPGQRMSAKQRHQLHTQLAGASCLLVERQAAPMQRLASALGLALVVADPLANDANLQSYSVFLEQLGEAFYRCLSSAGP